MMAKLFIILGLITVGLIACLRIAGFISADLTSDVLGRSLGIVAILGLTVGAISFILGRRQNSDGAQNPPNSGPKF